MNMKIYLVGGAVRDKILNIAHDKTEKDWVVVGSTPEELLQLGYIPVGKDFPVFLHPETHDEYALARTERKTGKGYKGFVFHASPDITLEEDLKRRDLTINAMAMDMESGEIIDPFGGKKDLAQKVLRHVSAAFSEDPVRILRLARLMARFGHLGFTIAEETQQLLTKMVLEGEVDALVRDRVWQEMHRALTEKSPENFFKVLDKCGALNILFPEINPQTLSCPHSDSMINFAKLFLPNTKNEIQQFCKRYPVPVEYRDLSLIANLLQPVFKKPQLTVQEMFFILEKSDAFRRKLRFQHLLKVFELSIHVDLLKKAFEKTHTIHAEKFIAQGLSGVALGKKIKEERLKVLEALSKQAIDFPENQQ